MTLFGTAPSPYTRRIRILLQGHDHQFEPLSFWRSEEDLYDRFGPVAKIPLLEDGGLKIFESRVIYKYLTEKFGGSKLDWDEENQVSVIDAMSDSLVNLFIIKSSGLDTTEDVKYFRIQRKRIVDSLDYLAKLAEQGAFTEWKYPAISLYTTLDWMRFRELWPIEHPSLLQFLESHQSREDVNLTDPRKEEKS